MSKTSPLILAILIIASIGLLACSLPFRFASSPQPTPTAVISADAYTLVIGHRGAAGLAPENTLAAIQVAVELGVDAVEFDVHRSNDGELMVIHDEEVERTTDGRGFVTNLTLEELQALDAGSWFSDEFAGEPIPSVRDVFDFVRDLDVLLFIELKSPALYSGIEAELVTLIEEYGYEDRVSILSFDHESLALVREIAPDLTLSGLWSRSLPSSDGAGFDVVNARFTLFRGTPQAIENYHGQELQVMVWTVNEISDMEWLIARGIDGITTDYPDRLLSVLGR